VFVDPLRERGFEAVWEMTLAVAKIVRSPLHEPLASFAPEMGAIVRVLVQLFATELTELGHIIVVPGSERDTRYSVFTPHSPLGVKRAEETVAQNLPPHQRERPPSKHPEASFWGTVSFGLSHATNV